MSKHKPKNERRVVNNAVKYWEGFLDALEWIRENDDENIDGRIANTKELIVDYQDRLFSIMLEDGRK
ncbi:hypothetical protein MJH12_10810 [bacterium]|nr:hypothetical protein [bacterium]